MFPAGRPVFGWAALRLFSAAASPRSRGETGALFGPTSCDVPPRRDINRLSQTESGSLRIEPLVEPDSSMSALAKIQAERAGLSVTDKRIAASEATMRHLLDDLFLRVMAREAGAVDRFLTNRNRTLGLPSES